MGLNAGLQQVECLVLSSSAGQSTVSRGLCYGNMSQASRNVAAATCVWPHIALCVPCVPRTHATYQLHRLLCRGGHSCMQTAA
jgi:hypothetical protein